MAELILIHEPVISIGKPRIVFIHGLDGDVRKTWMADRNDDNTLWPRWVGKDTGCPVWLLGYGAAMSRWKADSMALPRQARAVIESLSNEPRLLGGPLVLIGHSLGGLIIKTALRQGYTLSVERHKEVAKSVMGVAFVGTPHFGSKLAAMAAWSHFLRANPQMTDLQLDDAHLEELNRYFLALCKEVGLKTRVYAETQPIRLPWWLGGRFLPGVTVVSPTSAEAQIPGEVGIPIEANHVTICKPKDRSAAIHRSIVAFIKDVGTTIRSPQNTVVSIPTPLASENFDAILPHERASAAVHLAFSTFGVELDGGGREPICASVCLVTDTPDHLKHKVGLIRQAIQNDALLNVAAKGLARTASLRELALSPGTRALARRELAVISFSAYLYYCPREVFEGLSREERVRRLLVRPLFHRLSKKGEHIDQVHASANAMAEYLKQAAAEVQQAYHRSPKIPRLGGRKYCVLEELAALIAEASGQHLSDVSEADAAELFDSLRTRIRYAENVATGERHTRDENPLR
jgi:pimeloyl-ACP methyl ester carboxylesterase